MTAPIANLQPGELLGIVATGLTIAGQVWRSARKIAGKVEQLLGAVQANSQQSAQLQRQSNATKAELEQLRVRTERIEREGSIPIREVLRAVRTDVVPKLNQVTAEQTRVAGALEGNGGDADHR